MSLFVLLVDTIIIDRQAGFTNRNLSEILIAIDCLSGDHCFESDPCLWHTKNIDITMYLPLQGQPECLYTPFGTQRKLFSLHIVALKLHNRKLCLLLLARWQSLGVLAGILSYRHTILGRDRWVNWDIFLTIVSKLVASFKTFLTTSGHLPFLEYYRIFHVC